MKLSVADERIYDPRYAAYIMSHGDMSVYPICNGDTLLEAM